MSPDHVANALPTGAYEALTTAYAAYDAAAVRSAEQKQHSAELAVLAAAARSAGWPMRVLAEACGVSAERMRQFAARHKEAVPPEVAELFPVYQRPKPAARKQVERAHLSAAEAAALRELAQLASQNTGSHAADSPAARASAEFTELVQAHHARGVIWAEISDATRGWTSWPLTAAEAEAAAAGELEPLVRVSGLRQRIARAKKS